MEDLEKILNELEKLNFHSFNYDYKNKVITVIYDLHSTLCLVLVDWVYNYKFLDELLKKFDEFDIYDVNLELNIKIADWLEENLPLYF